MSIKSLTQILILGLIIFIIAAVYYKYFDTNKGIVEEINSLENANQEQLKQLETKILELELKNNELSQKIENNKKIENILLEDNAKKITKDEIIEKDKNIKNEIIEVDNSVKINGQNNDIASEEIKNFVKDVEYRSIDERGHNFYLL